MNGRWTQRIAADEALDRARLALAGLRLDAALSAVREAATLDPQDRPTRLLEAQVLLERNEPGAALAALDAAQGYGQSCEQAPMLWWLRAQALMRMANHAAAESALCELLKLAPMDGLAWEALLSVREAMGDAQGMREARAALQTLHQTPDLEAGVMDEIARLREAQRLLHQHRVADANEALSPLLPKGDDEPALLRRSAEVAEARGDAARLAHDAERLALLERGGRAHRHAWWLKAASAHLLNGDVRRASRCAWRAVQALQDEPRGWALLMLTLRELGRGRSAQRADRRLRRLTDRNTRRQCVAQWWPAITICRMHRQHTPACTAAPSTEDAAPRLLDELLEEARHALEGYSQRWPQRADGHLHRAVVADAMGRRADAIAALQTSLAHNAGYEKASRLLTSLRAA